MRGWLALLLSVAPTAATPVPVGLYGRWGAFRDGANCHAVTRDPAGGAWLAVIGGRMVAAGLDGAKATTLSVAGRRFTMSVGRLQAADAARAIATMRQRRSATIERRVGVSGTIRRRVSLDGAALAIDAATVACAR